MTSGQSLMSRYGGAKAQQYDDARKNSARYKAEEEAFQAYIREVTPSGILDCPFGTGRWLPYYLDIAGPVVGIDYSNDMLDVARSKLSGSASSIKLVRADIFETPLSAYRGEGIDLVVCTRFLNWFPAPKAAAALSRLSEVGARFAIIGASLRPNDAGSLAKLFARWRLSFGNARRRKRGAAMQYVHDEAWLLECFEKHNWRVREKRFIFSAPDRSNFFFLLERPEGQRS